MTDINLDLDRVDQCRYLARDISSNHMRSLSRKSTFSVERASLALMGLDGVTQKQQKVSFLGDFAQPLSHAFVELLGAERLARGASYWLACVLASQKSEGLNQAVLKFIDDGAQFDSLELLDAKKADQILRPLVLKQLEKLKDKKEQRFRDKRKSASSRNIRSSIQLEAGEEVVLEHFVKTAVDTGFDFIQIVTDPKQRWIDFIPSKSQLSESILINANSIIKMRGFLDQATEGKGSVDLALDVSGLNLAELSALAITQGADVIHVDALYQHLFLNIHLGKSLIDQDFALRLAAYSGTRVHGKEDQLLSSIRTHKEWQQLLAFLFLNESFSAYASLKEDQRVLPSRFKFDVDLDDALLYELAHILTLNEIFSRSEIRYFSQQGRFSENQLLNSHYKQISQLFALLTNQNLIDMGKVDQSMSSQLLNDLCLAQKSLQTDSIILKNLFSELHLQSNGKVSRRGRHVIDEAYRQLQKIKSDGLNRSFEKTQFAGLFRSDAFSKDKETLINKDKDYYNPVLELISKKGQVYRSTNRLSSRSPNRTQSWSQGKSQGRSQSRSQPRSQSRPQSGQKSGPEARDSKNSGRRKSANRADNSTRSDSKVEKPSVKTEAKTSKKSFVMRPSQQKPEEKKPQAVEKKVAEKKVVPERAVENKATENKSSEKKPVEKKVAEKKPIEKQIGEKKPIEKKAALKKKPKKPVIYRPKKASAKKAPEKEDAS